MRAEWESKFERGSAGGLEGRNVKGEKGFNRNGA